MKKGILFLAAAGILWTSASFAAQQPPRGNAARVSVGSYIRPASPARAATANQAPVSAMQGGTPELRHMERRIEAMEREIEALRGMVQEASANARPQPAVDEIHSMIEEALNSHAIEMRYMLEEALYNSAQ